MAVGVEKALEDMDLCLIKLAGAVRHLGPASVQRLERPLHLRRELTIEDIFDEIHSRDAIRFEHAVQSIFFIIEQENLREEPDFL